MLRPTPTRGRVRALLALSALSAILSCRTPEEWRQEADRKVYAYVADRRRELELGAEDFTIDPPADSLRARLLAGSSETKEPLGLGALLEIWAENSRDWQREKETLYLAALDYTLSQREFETQYGGGARSAGASGVGDDTTVEVSPFTRISRMLGTGATIVGDLGLRIFEDLASGNGLQAVTAFSLTFTQPLMRGAGRRIAQERLTQAERDVVYAVRAYERFRRTQSVTVADRMFRILQQADTVANEHANRANLELLRKRNEALAEAGRLSDIQVDQARQDELRAQDRVVVAEANYDALLDDFKLFLGLPVDAPLSVDPAELAAIDVDQLDLLRLDDEERVLSIALARRLDYQTALDEVDDADRRVHVAADGLRADLNLGGQAQWNSNLEAPSIDDLTWSAFVDLDLPIERTAERNAFRAALIDREEARRSAAELGDTITRDLRDQVRQARATRETYRINAQAVRVAERRVESTKLNFDAGRATTRDLLEAQEALVEAQNAATRARVDHHLSLLELFRDMEALITTPRGVEVDSEAIAPLLRESP